MSCLPSAVAEHQLAMPMFRQDPCPQPLTEMESGASDGVNFLHPASLAQPLFRRFGGVAERGSQFERGFDAYGGAAFCIVRQARERGGLLCALN
jgi:hypothetical protein